MNLLGETIAGILIVTFAFALVDPGFLGSKARELVDAFHSEADQ